MATNYDRGMDDAYLGKEPPRDATLEYLQGYGRAEELLYPEQQFPEQVDDRVQEDDREQERPYCTDCGSYDLSYIEQYANGDYWECKECHKQFIF